VFAGGDDLRLLVTTLPTYHSEKHVRSIKIIVEKHKDGYVAYPLGTKAVIVGEGDSYEEALADVKSAIGFHLKTFGKNALDSDSPVLEAFVAETAVNSRRRAVSSTKTPRQQASGAPPGHG
jgi:predicted RNase H-like HicB family nuclease